MIHFDIKLMESILQSLDLHGEAVLRVVPAQLHVGPECSVLQPSLGQFEGILLGPDSHLHVSNILFLVTDLAPGLKHETSTDAQTLHLGVPYSLHLILQLLLGSLHLVVSLPEVKVGGVLLDPQVVAGLLDGVEYRLPEPLRLRHGLLCHHLVVL